jgi:hypothetical protein
MNVAVQLQFKADRKEPGWRSGQTCACYPQFLALEDS